MTYPFHTIVGAGGRIVVDQVTWLASEPHQSYPSGNWRWACDVASQKGLSLGPWKTEEECRSEVGRYFNTTKEEK